MSEQVKPEDLDALRALKEVAGNKKVTSEVTALEAEIARLEYQNAVLKKYVEYGLKLEDHINVHSGEIIRKEDDESTEDEADEGAD